MYSTSPQIRSLDNTFIRAVKLEEADEDRKPYSLCGTWKNEFNSIAISIKIDDAIYKKSVTRHSKHRHKNSFGKPQGFLHTANAPLSKAVLTTSFRAFFT